MNMEEYEVVELNAGEQLKIKKFNNIVFYFIVINIFVFFSLLLSYTTGIWYLTRISGLVAYVLFFIAIVIGILRKISNKFAKYILLHKNAAIWGFLISILHFLSVIFDHYKWGYKISLLGFFGFDFSNSWMIFTSLGVLAFYSMLIVVVTSVGKNRRRLGEKLWKNIHYFSYVGFVMVQIHSTSIGTDFNHMSYSLAVRYLSYFMFMIVVVLFVIRVFVGVRKKNV